MSSLEQSLIEAERLGVMRGGEGGRTELQFSEWRVSAQEEEKVIYTDSGGSGTLV